VIFDWELAKRLLLSEEEVAGNDGYCHYDGEGDQAGFDELLQPLTEDDGV